MLVSWNGLVEDGVFSPGCIVLTQTIRFGLVFITGCMVLFHVIFRLGWRLQHWLNGVVGLV